MLCIIIIASYFVSLNAFAAEKTGITGGCMWELDGTVLTISSNVDGGGRMYDFDKSTAPWGKDVSKVIIKSNVKNISAFAFSKCKNLKSITISDSVVSISDLAFQDCGSLESITVDKRNSIYHSKGNCLIKTKTKELIVGCNNSRIPSNGTVTRIADGAFRGCTGLKSITIPDSITAIGVGAFEGCDNLTSITIDGSVTNIENYTFRGCARLVNVTLPNSVTSIGKYAFSYCKSLKNLILPNELTTVNSYAFTNCAGITDITIPNKVTQIANNAFSNCVGLKSVIINNGVISIGESAFYGCSSLTNIIIPNTVECVKCYTFYGCVGLTSITIPDGVKILEHDSFYGCTGLTNITIPSSIENIECNAFYGCNNIESITVDKSNKTYQSNRNCIIEVNTKELVLGCKNSVIPTDGSVKTIRSGAFGGSGLTNIFIPSSIISIESRAFSGCDNLKSITVDKENLTYQSNGNCIINVNTKELVVGCKNSIIPTDNSVKYIGAYAFYNCKGLTNISINDNIVSIGAYAFSCCENLVSLVIPNSVTSVDEGAFENSKNVNIKMPDNISYVGQRAFAGCTGLKSVTVPANGLIKYRAFFGCTGLENVTLSQDKYGNAPIIEEYAFDGCKNLISITMPGNVTNIGEQAFRGCNIKKLNILKGTKKITKEIVLWKDTLEEVNIPESVEYIYSGAFAGCKNLTSVTLSDSVIGIAEYAFSGCEKLKDIKMSNNLIYIGKYAFWGCTGLISITIPSSVTHIYSGAFYECSGLAEVHISDIAKWCAINFESNPLRYAKDLYLNGEKITELSIPDGVTGISKSAFSGCTAITSITIPDSVTSIGESAFYNCSSLICVTIPDSVISIDDYAFYNTPELVIYTIENSIAHEYARLNNIKVYLTKITRYIPSPNIEYIQKNGHSSVKITLQAITNYEYKCNDGEWQKSNVFDNLSFDKNYTFYQRLGKTNENVESSSSCAKTIYIKKANIDVPPTPTVLSKTANSVTLKDISGYEYSADGKVWQKSNVFTGLTEDTEYTFYQRIAETDTTYVSESSAPLKVKTDKSYTPGDLDGDEGITDGDVLYLLKHTFRPEKYPVNQPCDYNGDGEITDADAVYLLKHIFRPEKYPLTK